MKVKKYIVWCLTMGLYGLVARLAREVLAGWPSLTWPGGHVVVTRVPPSLRMLKLVLRSLVCHRSLQAEIHT